MKGSIVTKRGRPDSLYIVIDDDSPSGKRKQAWTTVHRLSGQTDRQLHEAANKKLRELLTKRDNGESIARDRLTVAEVWTQFRALHIPTLGGRTIASYEGIYRNYIEPALGNVKLSDLRPITVNRLYASMRARGLSERTILHCHSVLRKALNWAKRNELTSRNVCESVESPSPGENEPRIADANDLARVTSAADETSIAALVRLTLWTGLRLAEALGLRWADIDIERRRLRVAQTFGNDHVFREPKTKRSRRVISFAPEIVPILESHRKAQLEHYFANGLRPEHDLVFADPFGDPINHYKVNHVWRQIVKRAGVPGFRFHDLRHSHATHLLDQGVTLNVVQERLGHAHASITSDIYVHLLPGRDDAAASAMSRVMAAT